ncbi:MAG: hypothetical protein Q9216_002744 [Gyalolechia sp. 2 TL-2023]
MRSAGIISALVAIAAAAPAPSPQLIDLAAIDAAPDPVMVSAPLGVLSDQPSEKRGVTPVKRDGNCAVQPAGSGPVPTPDTAEAFLADQDLQATATNAPTPDGYSRVFANKDGSLSASRYMGLHTLKSFDTLGCASLCDQANGCEAFNMYIERDPSVAPNAADCPDPASTTNYKCTIWGAPVSEVQANNKGQWRASFHVVITGSNGYNKASPPDSIDAYTGPTGLGGAINAPLDNGKNTYLGFKYYPFSQTQGYTPESCATACNAQTAYNSRHPNADGSYAKCPLDLTTALRPSLLPDETLLFVQDAVGLYEGKFKVASYQNGYAYLTSHRACYVDNAEPRRNSVAINLREIERYELYAGFLKSSPKITLYPKSSQRPALPSPSRATNPTTQEVRSPPQRNDSASTLTRTSSPSTNSPRSNNATWICPICSYSNLVPSNFDAASASLHTPLPPCLACGIKPPLAHVLKAAIASISGRSTASGHPLAVPQGNHSRHSEPASNSSRNASSATPDLVSSSSVDSRFRCPQCTFQNHPSLLACELCGSPLTSAKDLDLQRSQASLARPESPGPSLSSPVFHIDKTAEGVKFSFRAGGEKVFYERLKGAMTQRKWLLQNAPPIPKPQQPSSGTSNPLPDSYSESRPKVVGIAGLERRGLDLRKDNEVVIGNAFEDLEALMASAKEVVALAEKFAHRTTEKSTEGDALLVESATVLGMVTTKDMLGSNTGSETLYLSELSRNVAEYLTDDAKGILRKEGGIMSLVDLWAVFNRIRGGVELISPGDFEKAARLWEKLGLPVKLRQFKNGLLVVQRHDWTDDKTIAQLLDWLQDLHTVPPEGESQWDWSVFGRGVTAQEAAVRFGWSIGIASEELEMAEEKGVLCREEGVEGIKYWENWIVQGDE